MRVPANEIGLPLVKAVKKATGNQYDLSTVFRWSQRPNRHGVQMESWLEGGRRVTSVQAVRRYIQRTTDAANRLDVQPSPHDDSAAHQAAAQEVDRELGGKQ